VYQRILSSPPDSLLYQSYKSLREVSSVYQIKKYSWCIQLSDLLTELGFSNVWIKDCPKFLSVHRNPILKKLRQDLGVEDTNRARASNSVPHYHLLSNGYETEDYLTLDLPAYMVTCICQTRLNYSIIYNKGMWYDLSMFKRKICRFCGDDESFSHIFLCPHFSDLRHNLFPLYMLISNYDDVLKLIHPQISLPHCKSWYFLSQPPYNVTLTNLRQFK